MPAPPFGNQDDPYYVIAQNAAPVSIPAVLLAGPGSSSIFNASTFGLRSFALQVKGVGGVATSWNVVLEAGIDASNFTAIVQHTDGDGDGKIVFTGANLYPCLYLRVTLVSVVLGPASSLSVAALGL